MHHKYSDVRGSADWEDSMWNELLLRPNIMQKFAESPHISCSLTFCSLSRNQISDEGACKLAGALQINQNLQKLE